jgi:hypothetical protein
LRGPGGCRVRGLPGCRPDGVAAVDLKGGDVVTGGASLTKLQHDVCFRASGPSLRGEPFELSIGNQFGSILHFTHHPCSRRRHRRNAVTAGTFEPAETRSALCSSNHAPAAMTNAVAPNNSCSLHFLSLRGHARDERFSLLSYGPPAASWRWRRLAASAASGTAQPKYVAVAALRGCSRPECAGGGGEGS